MNRRSCARPHHEGAVPRAFNGLYHAPAAGGFRPERMLSAADPRNVNGTGRVRLLPRKRSELAHAPRGRVMMRAGHGIRERLRLLGESHAGSNARQALDGRRLRPAAPSRRSSRPRRSTTSHGTRRRTKSDSWRSTKRSRAAAPLNPLTSASIPGFAKRTQAHRAGRYARAVARKSGRAHWLCPDGWTLEGAWTSVRAVRAGANKRPTEAARWEQGQVRRHAVFAHLRPRVGFPSATCFTTCR